MVFSGVSEVTNTSTVTDNKTGKVIANQATRRKKAQSRPKANFAKVFGGFKSSSSRKPIQVKPQFAITDPRVSKFLRKAQGTFNKTQKTAISKSAKKPKSSFVTQSQSKSPIRVNLANLSKLFGQSGATSNTSPSIPIQQRKAGIVTDGSTTFNKARLDNLADKLNLPRGAKPSDEEVNRFIEQGGVEPLGFDSLLFNPSSPTGFSAGDTPLARVPDPDSETGFRFEVASQPQEPVQQISDFLSSLFGIQTEKQTETIIKESTVFPTFPSTTNDALGIPEIEDTQGNAFGGGFGDAQDDGQDSEGLLNNIINDPVKLGIAIIAGVTLFAGVVKK